MFCAQSACTSTAYSGDVDGRQISPVLALISEEVEVRVEPERPERPERKVQQ